MKTVNGDTISLYSPEWITDEMVYNEQGRFCSALDRVQRMCKKLITKERYHENMAAYDDKNEYPPLTDREAEFLNKHNPYRRRMLKQPLEVQRYNVLLKFRHGELKPSTFELIFGVPFEIVEGQAVLV